MFHPSSDTYNQLKLYMFYKNSPCKSRRHHTFLYNNAKLSASSISLHTHHHFKQNKILQRELTVQNLTYITGKKFSIVQKCNILFIYVEKPTSSCPPPSSTCSTQSYLTEITSLYRNTYLAQHLLVKGKP